MRQILSLFCLLFLASGMPAVVTEVASLRGFLYGTEDNCSYDNWVSHVSEGQVSWLNVYAPWEEQNDDFGEYLIPTEQDLRNWDQVVQAFLALDLTAAEAWISQYELPYEVVVFQDLDSGRNLYMLREILNDDIDGNGTEDTSDDETGSFEYSWGLYIFDPNASRPMVITAPHPCDDYPSPVFALESFLELDARFLLINAAGREVAYFPPYNSNNQSISDPSRMDAHPFNVFYQRCADQLRAITGKTEFSLQIHSYDWNKYSGQPNVMLSAGNGREYPALPLRDDSRLNGSLVNRTPFLVHPANSLGTHSEVDITDYYCVNYNTAEPVWYTGGGQHVQVPRNTELPGAQYNQQMLYTEQQNLFDVYSPFLHVEMDELPKCYVRNEANWRWFFGYDAEAESWNLDQRYDRFIAFYRPWLVALDAVIDSMLILDDGTGPSNPENLSLTSLANSRCRFQWDRSYAYDFDSYVINLRYEDEGEWFNLVLDRHTDPSLAWQNTSTYYIDLEQVSRVYYLRIQARDKHGNTSPWSNELKVWNVFAPIYDVTANEGDGLIGISFNSYTQTHLGFNIYRAQGDSAFELHSSWHNNPDLQTHPETAYSYTDHNVSNGAVYRYQVSAQYSDGYEAFGWAIATVSPYRPYSLNLANTQNADTCFLVIGANPLATDALDSYDVEVESTSGQLLIVTPGTQGSDPLIRDIRMLFDPSVECKVWSVHCRSPLAPANLSLCADPSLLAAGADLLLYDENADFWHDLRQGPYLWTQTTTGWRIFKFFWGKNLPRVQFAAVPNACEFAGMPLNLQWKVLNAPRVAFVDLWFCAPGDSFLVAQNLSPHINQLNYLPPQCISGGRLRADLHCLDGVQLCFYSRNYYDVIPQNTVYQHPPGFSLFSIPLWNFAQETDDLLGANASAYLLAPNQTWQAAQTLVFGQGYLISHDQGFQLNLPAELPFAPWVQTLYQGWNLLANPFNRDFDLADLEFTYQGVPQSYPQMVADSLLAPLVILAGADGLQPGSLLPARQAAFLFYQSWGVLTATFDPLAHGAVPVEWADQWSVSLSLDDGYHSPDAVQVGTADASSPGFDLLYDLPKPPAFPDAPYRIALSQFDPVTVQTRLLQTDYAGLYPWYNDAEKIWTFEFENSEPGPLRFRLDSSRLPNGYSADLCVNGQLHSLTNYGQYWIDLPSAGLNNGWLRIRNYQTSGLAAAKESGLNAYPNPFRTGIAVQLPDLKGAAADIAVYNLRGQKVRQLASGTTATGGTPLYWDGTDAQGRQVAPGIYLLRAEFLGQTVTRKLVRQ